MSNMMLVYRKKAYAASSQGGIDPSLQDVLDYASSQSYATASTIYINAIDTLIKGLKEAEIWDLLFMLYVFANDGSDGFRCINIRNINAYNATLHGGIISTTNGYQGNNVNAYIDTHWIPSYEQMWEGQNASMGTVTYSDTALVLVARTSAAWNLLLRSDNGSAAHRINTSNNNVTGGTVPMAGQALKIISRTGNSIYFYNGSNIYTRTNSSVSVPNQNCYLFGLPPASDYRTGSASLVFAGSYITAEHAVTIRTLFNNYYQSTGVELIA